MSNDKLGIDVLVAVHHPTRRRIVDYLVLEGPSQVGAMATALDQQVGSISHHLRMLERAGVVERAPELATDGRTSWWRWANVSIRWGTDDFADDLADLHRAKVADRLNFEHHVRRFTQWKRRSDGYEEHWRRAASSSDALAKATPQELAELARRLEVVVRDWRDEIDDEDGQDRQPVFVFTHAFPTQP